ncbi:RNA-directed DNA polymerase protein [Dioscorea alata]|uniref:RNA-directed DNA polymerase protein n=1 Tax=Dioscorea alata TaxID=55571 RepID=A0ACB7WTW5_DIOAL|nr:RNA-directed DNA polymerase protein [Dioscorea alata]
MNLITWNVRGLCRPAKRFLVRDFLNIHCSDVCCLQESKLSEISQSVWREIGGTRFDKFVYLPARRSTGGIIIRWNSLVVDGKLEGSGTFSLSVNFQSKRDNLIWSCTAVYGPNLMSSKAGF